MKQYNLKLTENELFHVQTTLPLNIEQMKSYKQYNEERLIKTPGNKDCESNIKIYGDVQKTLENVLDKIRLISPFKGLNPTEQLR